MENKVVDFKMVSGYQMIMIKGRMTYDNISEYKHLIKEGLVDADGYMMNLNGVEQIDSTGIGLVVNTGKKFINNHSKLVIIVTNDLIKELFVLSKLDMILRMAQDETEAIALMERDDEEYWDKISKY